MPAIFEQQGIRFEYPENWTLDAADPVAGQLSVTVSSPAAAFWSLSRYPGDVDPTELLREVLATMQSEYPGLEVDEAEDEIEELKLVGFDLNFFYLDLCNTTTVRGFHLAGATYLLFCQAEDHELDEVEPVFQAMTTSLVRDARQRDG